MKNRTVYTLEKSDKDAIIKWLNRDISYREMAPILRVSYENARTHIAGILRQMYEEGEFVLKSKQQLSTFTRIEVPKE